MPCTQNPADEDELKIWKETLESKLGVVIAGITPMQRSRVRQKFKLCPITGSVVEKTSEKPVVVISKMEALMKQYHDQANHCGRDATKAALQAHYSCVPGEHVKTYILDCTTCSAKRYIRAYVVLCCVIHSRLF